MLQDLNPLKGFNAVALSFVYLMLFENKDIGKDISDSRRLEPWFAFASSRI